MEGLLTRRGPGLAPHALTSRRLSGAGGLLQRVTTPISRGRRAAAPRLLKVQALRHISGHAAVTTNEKGIV